MEEGKGHCLCYQIIWGLCYYDKPKFWLLHLGLSRVLGQHFVGSMGWKTLMTEREQTLLLHVKKLKLLVVLGSCSSITSNLQVLVLLSWSLQHRWWACGLCRGTEAWGVKDRRAICWAWEAAPLIECITNFVSMDIHGQHALGNWSFKLYGTNSGRNQGVHSSLQCTLHQEQLPFSSLDFSVKWCSILLTHMQSPILKLSKLVLCEWCWDFWLRSWLFQAAWSSIF